MSTSDSQEFTFSVQIELDDPEQRDRFLERLLEHLDSMSQELSAGRIGKKPIGGFRLRLAEGLAIGMPKYLFEYSWLPRWSSAGTSTPDEPTITV